jgi:hypothetical protein
MQFYANSIKVIIHLTTERTYIIEHVILLVLEKDARPL